MPGFDVCSAGTRPKSNAVARHTPAENANTRPSTVNLIQYGKAALVRSALEIARIAARESPQPAAPASVASSRLSISNCRMICARPAPIAMRTDISCDRTAARASSRLATFAHAISSTTATTPISTGSVDRPRPPTDRSRYGTTIGATSRFVSGYCCPSAAAIPRKIGDRLLDASYRGPAARMR